MASDKHDDIREFMEETKRQGGRPPAGKRLVQNPQTGKFEVRSVGERLGDDVPQFDVEDMQAFGRG